MIVINNKQVYSDENKYVHRVGTETYFKKAIVLPTDTVADFEEVEELPKYTRQEYKEKVRELIKLKYSIEDEIALYRQRDIKSEEFDEYYKYCEECKVKAKIELNKEGE